LARSTIPPPGYAPSHGNAILNILHSLCILAKQLLEIRRMQELVRSNLGDPGAGILSAQSFGGFAEWDYTPGTRRIDTKT